MIHTMAKPFRDHLKKMYSQETEYKELTENLFSGLFF